MLRDVTASGHQLNSIQHETIQLNFPFRNRILKLSHISWLLFLWKITMALFMFLSLFLLIYIFYVIFFLLGSFSSECRVILLEERVDILGFSKESSFFLSFHFLSLY